MASSHSNPPPNDDLDARVDSLLRQIDEAKARVEARQDGREVVAPVPVDSFDDGGLDDQLSAALGKAATAKAAPAPSPPASPVPTESVAQPLPPTPPSVPPFPSASPSPPGARDLSSVKPSSARVDAGVSAPAVSPPPPPTGPVVSAPMSPPPATSIKELDAAMARSVERVGDDDFADGSEMVGDASLEVPLPDVAPSIMLPPSRPLGALPEIAPVAPAAPAAAPAPAPVHAPAPTPVAPKPPPPAPPKAPPPPAPKPVAPKPAPAPKPDGPTWKDRFWTVATPVIEPIAVRIGKLPKSTQQTAAWIGLVTLFMAGIVWVYVLLLQETRPQSHVDEANAKAAHEDSSHEAPKPDTHATPKADPHDAPKTSERGGH